jgi:hypothetical protein
VAKDEVDSGLSRRTNVPVRHLEGRPRETIPGDSKVASRVVFAGVENGDREDRAVSEERMHRSTLNRTN